MTVRRFLLIFAALAGLGLSGAPALGSEAPEERQERIGGRFMLVNHFGETVTNADFRGRFQLVFFGYTFCPDICPTSLQTISEALDILGRRAEAIQPLFVSVDPARDTPAALRAYVAHFHPSIIGLTGPDALVARAAQQFNVVYEKVVTPDAPADQYIMDHSAGVYLMGPDGGFIVKFAHGIPPRAMADRLADIIR